MLRFRQPRHRVGRFDRGRSHRLSEASWPAGTKTITLSASGLALCAAEKVQHCTSEGRPLLITAFACFCALSLNSLRAQESKATADKRAKQRRKKRRDVCVQKESRLAGTGAEVLRHSSMLIAAFLLAKWRIRFKRNSVFEQQGRKIARVSAVTPTHAAPR